MNCTNEIYGNCTNRKQVNYMLKVNDFDNLSGNEDTLNYRQLLVQSSNDSSQLKSREGSSSEMVQRCNFATQCASFDNCHRPQCNCGRSAGEILGIPSYDIVNQGYRQLNACYAMVILLYRIGIIYGTRGTHLLGSPRMRKPQGYVIVFVNLSQKIRLSSRRCLV